METMKICAESHYSYHSDEFKATSSDDTDPVTIYQCLNYSWGDKVCTVTIYQCLNYNWGDKVCTVIGS